MRKDLVPGVCLLVCLLVCLMGVALPWGGAVAQDIVLPADDPGIRQAAPQQGTDLVMKPYTVKDQNQLRGRYGAAWSEAEVRSRAAQTCAEHGMRLVYFKSETRDGKGRTEFAAVCR
ncbi:hypothetical protein [Sagittula salina]|uniref:Uncharacterized protein n=1 Tax=Sagittula salina TaxID=2820268 RepID=A0A940S155_9RHOB|nr:hypothetical protein [Sagittula salina]MBP0483783.1 hypothetical protein [Sagittula salina]